MINTTVGSLLDLSDSSPEKESIFVKMAKIGKQVPLASDRWRISSVLMEAESPINRARPLREEMLRKYAVIKGDKWVVEGPNLASFSEESKKLKEEPVTLQVEKLPMNIFDNTDITPADLIALVAGGIVERP